LGKPLPIIDDAILADIFNQEEIGIKEEFNAKIGFGLAS